MSSEAPISHEKLTIQVDLNGMQPGERDLEVIDQLFTILMDPDLELTDDEVLEVVSQAYQLTTGEDVVLDTASENVDAQLSRVLQKIVAIKEKAIREKEQREILKTEDAINAAKQDPDRHRSPFYGEKPF